MMQLDFSFTLPIIADFAVVSQSQFGCSRLRRQLQVLQYPRAHQVGKAQYPSALSVSAAAELCYLQTAQ